MRTCKRFVPFALLALSGCLMDGCTFEGINGRKITLGFESKFVIESESQVTTADGSTETREYRDTVEFPSLESWIFKDAEQDPAKPAEPQP